MTVLTKAERTKKNKLIGKADWIGVKIDMMGLIESVSRSIRDKAAAKIISLEDEQSKLLDKVDEIRKNGGVKLIEAGSEAETN